MQLSIKKHLDRPIVWVLKFPTLPTGSCFILLFLRISVFNRIKRFRNSFTLSFTTLYNLQIIGYSVIVEWKCIALYNLKVINLRLFGNIFNSLLTL